MLNVFTGSSTHKLDAKGRVSLPASYRKVLEALGSTHIVVLPQMHRPEAHVVLSEAGYDEVMVQFEELELDPDDEEALGQRICAAAQQIPIDEAGRILLSKELREPIGLSDEVRFVGGGSSFEIWDPGRRNTFNAALQARSRELARKIRLKGLHR